MSKARDLDNYIGSYQSSSETLTNKTIDGNNNTIRVKRGTTANRPVSATVCDQYYDTDIEALFNYCSDGWKKMADNF